MTEWLNCLNAQKSSSSKYASKLRFLILINSFNKTFILNSVSIIENPNITTILQNGI